MQRDRPLRSMAITASSSSASASDSARLLAPMHARRSDCALWSYRQTAAKSTGRLSSRFAVTIWKMLFRSSRSPVERVIWSSSFRCSSCARILSPAARMSVMSCNVQNQLEALAASAPSPTTSSSGSIACRMCIHSPLPCCRRYSTSTRAPVEPATMARSRKRARSSGCTSASHSRVVRGTSACDRPRRGGSESDQLTKAPPDPVMMCVIRAIRCVRRSAASACLRPAMALSSSIWCIGD